MGELKAVLVLTAAIAFLPHPSNAAESIAADAPATLQREADLYAFEAKQYRAAGKPLTDAVAKRFARTSASYRLRASRAPRDR